MPTANDKIVIVTPHPDDETLGCGGTILKLIQSGANVHWLIVTAMDPKDGFSPETIQTRRSEISQVAASYRFASTTEMNLPTTRLDEIPTREFVGAFGNVFRSLQPHTIYCPNRSDAHSDHRAIFEAVLSCTKWFRFPFVKRLFLYEVLSETEFAPAFSDSVFVPNSFSDISEYLEEKIRIMTMYRSEMGTHPFPRSEESIRALAAFRGAQAGARYAEAFTLLKEIW